MDGGDLKWIWSWIFADRYPDRDVLVSFGKDANVGSPFVMIIYEGGLLEGRRDERSEREGGRMKDSMTLHGLAVYYQIMHRER